MNDLKNIPLTSLKGIGEKTAKLFAKLNIHNVYDLLHHFPRDYVTYESPVLLSDAKEDSIVTLKLTIAGSLRNKKVRNLTITNAMGRDNGAAISLTFFNSPFLLNILKPGSTYLFRGKIINESGRLVMEQPKVYTQEEYQKLMNGLQPSYPLTAHLTNHMVSKAMKQAVLSITEKEYLPENILSEYALISKKQAFMDIHFPTCYEDMLKARNRLCFDEFFVFLLAIRLLKDKSEAQDTIYPMIETAQASRFMEQLPYKLTGAQQKVWEEVKEDLTSGKTMNRLIQGDVGSGKTILAFLALIMTVSNGYQGALMAPTEILATQHFEQLMDFANKYHLPLKPVLLTGSVSAKNKREIYAKIEAGDFNVIIGTHALIQEKVNYKNLALVITDEQHRFGVKQRESFSRKGQASHILVMSATPIPRSLAIILYGDMHLSVVDELPANRLPIKNCVVGKNYRPKAYEFIEKEVAKGHQAYVICPMVDENDEDSPLENVIDYTLTLKNELPDKIRVSYLHGKMKPIEKNKVMEDFASGNIDVLVSTTVIEVGINVPNATVMMIENAQRFGLAQLHQLRGRIGRGNAQSYCIFINTAENDSSKERLDILNHSNDGFFIAQEDLKLRGPGDLFGIRQSGDMEFRIADIYQDSKLLKKVSKTVDEILLEDEHLQSPKYSRLGTYLTQNMAKFIDFTSI